MSLTLNATAREAGKNLNSLRAEGIIPAVVYGAGQKTESISVPFREFVKVFKEAGESGTIDLVLPSGKVSVLVHEVVNDPIRHIPAHIDFLAIDISKPIEVTIPIEFTGVSPAAKGGLGVLVKVMHEIEVKGLPKDIPHTVAVDLSPLATLDSHITIADIVLPANVVALAKPTEIVANVSAIKEEKEAPTAIDFSAIEVEKKGKKEEEGGEAAA